MAKHYEINVFEHQQFQTSQVFGLLARIHRSLLMIGSQPFAQVLLCFSSGALLLKNNGNKDDPNC